MACNQPQQWSVTHSGGVELLRLPGLLLDPLLFQL
jgi:hypothetical protein